MLASPGDGGGGSCARSPFEPFLHWCKNMEGGGGLGRSPLQRLSDSLAGPFLHSQAGRMWEWASKRHGSWFFRPLPISFLVECL